MLAENPLLRWEHKQVGSNHGGLWEQKLPFYIVEGNICNYTPPGEGCPRVQRSGTSAQAQSIVRTKTTACACTLAGVTHDQLEVRLLGVAKGEGQEDR